MQSWPRTWWATVPTGWGLVVIAVIRVGSTSGIALLPAFMMAAALSIVLELLPLTQGRRAIPQGVVMSTSFTCAVMFVWGPWPAIVIIAVGSLASDVRAGKTWWKTVFNPAQYALTVFVASLVVRSTIGTATISRPWAEFHAHHIVVMAGAWVV